jgi:hypothetical protein
MRLGTALVLPAGLAVALAAAPSAAAEPAWSGPQAVPLPGGLSPVVTVDGGDRALVDWTTTRPLSQRLATRPPGGSWTAAGRLEGRLYELQLGSYGQSRVLLVGREARTRSHGGDRMMAAFGSSSGRFGTFTQLDRGTGSSPFLSSPSLSVDRGGGAVAAWTRERAGGSDVRVALRSPGRSFGAAQSIGRGDPSEPAAGIDSRGDVVVAWSGKKRVWARIRLAGHRWGAAHAIGVAVTRPGTISAAAGGPGQFIVSWQSATIADEEQGIPATVTVKAAALAGGRWHASLLELARTFLDLGQVPATEVAFAGARGGIVVWEGVSGSATAIKTAALGPGGSFSAPALVSAPGRSAWFGDLAVGSTGAATIAWLDPSALPSALEPLASYAPPGQPFGPPASLMPGARGALGMSAAISPATGLPTVVWSAALPSGSPAVYASTLRSP